MQIFNFDGGRKMVRNLITILIVAVVGIGVVFVAGCESDAQTGALIGTGIGAGVGQAIGGDAQSTILGGVVGGSLGYGIGNEGDKKNAAADRQAIRNEMNIETVNVTCSNGSIIPVRLQRQGVVYIGPRGETYPKLPTEEDLRPLYGF